jgi:hypothetical protein
MRGIAFYLACLACAVYLAGPAVGEAQPLPEGYGYSITPVVHPKTSLDEGGDASFVGGLFSFSSTHTLNPRTSAGWRTYLDYQDWSFDDAAAFAGTTPWGDLYRYGLSATYARVADNGWVWNVSPTIGFTGESGAEFSEALEYGATIAAVRRYSDTLTLGFGLGLFRQIEDNFIFPLVVVNWQINEKWRLSNPLPGGPAGPAGFEFSYAIGQPWTLGFGATQRRERYRLDSDGDSPGGVGEHRYAVVFSRLGRQLTATTKIDFYLGAEVETRFRVEDPDGRRLFSEDADPGLILGISLAGRL